MARTDGRSGGNRRVGSRQGGGGPACLLAGALLALAGCGVPPSESDARALDAEFVAQRIFVRVPVAEPADTLRFYTDTGGGLFLLRRAAERIGVGDSAGVRLSELATTADFPDPRGRPDGRVPLFAPEGARDVGYDGMLGQDWFADRVWTFDYPGRALLLHEGGLEGDLPGSRAPLWFRTDSAGARALSFPRIRVRVDGDTLDLLFDTGATLGLTDSGLAALGDDGPRERATSFIVTEVFERWRERHPEWRVIPEADRNLPGMAAIEVPAVEIAGHQVGPVWFTQRPDGNFREYMAQWMDRPVDGALGGNALGFFRVTVDYPGGAAGFAREE